MGRLVQAGADLTSDNYRNVWFHRAMEAGCSLRHTVVRQVAAFSFITELLHTGIGFSRGFSKDKQGKLSTQRILWKKFYQIFMSCPQQNQRAMIKHQSGTNQKPCVIPGQIRLSNWNTNNVHSYPVPLWHKLHKTVAVTVVASHIWQIQFCRWIVNIYIIMYSQSCSLPVKP